MSSDAHIFYGKPSTYLYVIYFKKHVRNDAVIHSNVTAIDN